MRGISSPFTRLTSVAHQSTSSSFLSHNTTNKEVKMASTTLAILPPSLILNVRKTLFRTLPKFPVSAFGDKRKRIEIVAKAAGETSESSTSLSIVKSVQNVWDKPEDRIAVVGFGFAAVVALWASTNLVGAIDKLPILPSTLEFIGILFSWWFTYRYLLFKPDREELVQMVNKSISNILGQ